MIVFDVFIEPGSYTATCFSKPLFHTSQLGAKPRLVFEGELLELKYLVVFSYLDEALILISFVFESLNFSLINLDCLISCNGHILLLILVYMCCPNMKQLLKI